MKGAGHETRVKMMRLQVLIYELYLPVQRGLCILRGVHQLKSDGTPVPIVDPILFHLASMLDVFWILVLDALYAHSMQ